MGNAILTRNWPSARTFSRFQWLGKYFILSYTMKNKKGQGTLEIGIVLIVIIVLLYGLIHIWIWGNKQIVLRQIAYNNTRGGEFGAGKSRDSYTEPVWWNYTPAGLRKEDVLVNR